MNTNGQSDKPQTLKKPGSPSGDSRSSRALPTAFQSQLAEVIDLIDHKKSDKEVFDAIVARCVRLEGITSAMLFFPSNMRGQSRDLVPYAHAGREEIPEPATSRSKSGSLKQSDSGVQPAPRFHYYRVNALWKTVGWLGVAGELELGQQTEDGLRVLAMAAGVAYEKPLAIGRIEHLSNKLEVLGELNKLIASGSSSEKICRTIAREAAFRFGAACGLVILLPEAEEFLEIAGSYGFPPKALPETLEIQETQFGRTMKLGGMMSIPDLRVQQDHGLDFLSQLGFSCAHWSSIDIRGESLGAIVIGYREPRQLSDLEGDMFEEFARGTAVAIVSARNREKLAKYASSLEDLVEERTRDLAVQTARADEANQAKSRFVANMSHELRSPLTAIVGYSSVLSEGIFGPVNNEQKDALVAIANAAEHLKDLINDVLDISKVEAGKEDPEPAEVEITKLIEQVCKLMMQTAMGKGVQLLPFKAEEDLQALKVWVDARHIRQILINLMSNAIKYTPPSGTVSMRLEKLGDKAKVVIADTGVGIPPEERDKLFERFHRVDDSYSRTQVGTGIGLSLTKRLIEMNGGKIGVDSEVGKGSEFWILVPLVQDKEQGTSGSLVEESEEALLDCRLDGLNILVVDDNQLTCEVLATIIRSVGGMPYIAYSVADAKKIAEETDLDTALIDLAIPGENGIDLLDYFRHECRRQLSNMPLVVVSACVFDSDRQEAMRHGAAAFVAKPFSPARIVSTIRSLTTAAVLHGA